MQIPVNHRSNKIYTIVASVLAISAVVLAAIFANKIIVSTIFLAVGGVGGGILHLKARNSPLRVFGLIFSCLCLTWMICSISMFLFSPSALH